MIIDFHTHIFPEKIAAKTIEFLEHNCDGKAFTDGTVNGLLTQMERGGVDISVALPVVTKPSQFDSINRFAIGINETFKDSKRRIISFGGIHPLCENISEKMKFLKENGFIGVKIHPDYQDEFIDHEGYIKILKAAKDLDMVVVTHAGVDDGYKGQPVKCPPILAEKVINKVGHKKFVLGHYGGHLEWEEVLTRLAGKDVYFDTAFTLHEISKDLFLRIMEKHGADNILFATDCPWRDMKTDIDTFNSFGINKEDSDKILYKNAEKLLNLR